MNAVKQDEPEDIELLLPWHAAGTLSRRDAARVEQALANDNELAARYELVREELGEAIRLNESLGAPSARAMETLFAKIDAEPAREQRASFSIGAWLTNFVAGFSPRTLAYSGIAAALAIVLQAAVITGVFVGGAAGPQLASYEQGNRPGQSANVMVRFKPQASAAEITAFLRDNKATVVDGPAAGTGLFRLRVASATRSISEAPMSQDELDAVVSKMAKSPVVGLVLPAGQP